MTHVTLPNLRWLWLMFGGVSAYLEALLSRMTAALLEKLEIVLFHQLTFAVPSRTASSSRAQRRISGLGWPAFRRPSMNSANASPSLAILIPGAPVVPGIASCLPLHCACR
ncbi:hypothetical protein BC826DRAFT_227723 [Russula brevipes]|nr:hypothetical protein BC826DRAFT_227723 [Russula brevipes]